jgi:ornithine carbamoyltransferase
MYAQKPHPTTGSVSAATLSEQEAAALLDKARALQRAEQQGSVSLVLKGKRLALLRNDDAPADAALFCAAAAELGAQVAQVSPRLSLRSSARQVASTARVLSLLYDGIDCEGLPHELVQRLQDAATVPVHDGIAGPGHPAAALAQQLEGPCPDKNRRLLVQALLVDSLGGPA